MVYTPVQLQNGFMAVSDRTQVRFTVQPVESGPVLITLIPTIKKLNDYLWNTIIEGVRNRYFVYARTYCFIELKDMGSYDEHICIHFYNIGQ